MIFALVGNQNCGKTTLFNALTGSNQHVGNFPGVTVDQKMGAIKGAKDSSVVDLPGIYSLRPYTQEEIVSRDFIINQKPDGIINIVDATNIERNLYLTLQLLELRVPMVLALNMMDEVRSNGGTINVKKMSDALGIPVVPISAAKGEGVSELVDQALQVAKSKTLPKVWDFCSDGAPVHRCIHAVTHLIADHAARIGVPARFCATKLIDGGDDLARLGVGADVVLRQSVDGAGKLQVGDVAGDKAEVGAACAQHGHIGQRFNKSDRPVHGGGGDEAHQAALAISRGVEDDRDGGGEHQQQNHHRKVPDAAVVMDGIHISHICFFHGVILLSLRTASR